MTSAIEHIHGRHVHTRRVRVLASHFAALLPRTDQARVLDVGCGDGLIDQLILEKLRNIDATNQSTSPVRHSAAVPAIEGIDVLVRPDAHISVTAFDGDVIPHTTGAFDAVMLIDVLHHTVDPMILLREALRVTKPAGMILIKDHTMDGLLAGPTLRFMDRVGNARHGVVLPYNYWTKRKWDNAFGSLGLIVETWIDRVGLYPFPANLVFGRSLHFVARLIKR